MFLALCITFERFLKVLVKKIVVSLSNNFLPFVTTEAVTGTHDNYHESYYQNECQTYEYHFF